MNDRPEIAHEPDLRNAIHALSIAEVYRTLGVSPLGLSTADVVDRRQRFGTNVIRTVPGKPLLFKFIANVTHLMALLLWGGGIIAFAAGLPQLGWAIWTVVIINAVFSFWQEYRASKAMEALRSLLPPSALVLRDGREQRIPAADLVPGDLVQFVEGDRISADCRLVQEAELRVDQSALSGESQPLRKTAEAVLLPGTVSAERANLLFAGTTVTTGTGRAVVFATGMDTEFGTIAGLTLGVVEELSPLQKEINRMTRVVALLAVSIGVVFFLLSVFVMARPLSTGFMFALGMVVAFVPEGLLPTVTLALAMGVQRMARRNALIKSLSSVETLGSCTVICTDKTGTLTQNEMTVRSLWVAGHTLSVSGTGYAPDGSITAAGLPIDDPDLAADLRQLLLSAALCNDARVVRQDSNEPCWKILGDPTEAALQVAARKGGLDPDEQQLNLPRWREIPFDSRRKRMSTVHRIDAVAARAAGAGFAVFVKGAPKEILALSESLYRAGDAVPLSEIVRSEIMAATDAYARNGLRVLAIAMRHLPAEHGDFSAEFLEQKLVFLGLAAMLDPPREEVAAAVATCRRAGIRIIMVTGDYGLTAESIARRIGIVGAGRPRVITGQELDCLDDASLGQALAGEVIFARVAPEHKLRVVTSLQALSEVVAVTGDGVNDAPALKKADIGVAMGLSGTDVARESADMVLADDNFASIVYAIEEGRGVYANIRKFVTYIFSSNMPEAWPFILQILCNVPLALNIMQILAIDLGTDMVPALALGTERPEPGIMDKPPRCRHERLIDAPLLVRSMLWLGTLQTALCFAGFFALYWYFGYRDLFSLPRVDLLPLAERLLSRDGTVYVLASTVFFTAVVMTQIGNAYACRTVRTSVFSIGFFSNRFLLAGILVELVLAALLMYTPVLGRIFEFSPLPPHIWLFLFALPPILLAAEECRKVVVRWRAQRRDSLGGVP